MLSKIILNESCQSKALKSANINFNFIIILSHVLYLF